MRIRRCLRAGGPCDFSPHYKRFTAKFRGVASKWLMDPEGYTRATLLSYYLLSYAIPRAGCCAARTGGAVRLGTHLSRSRCVPVRECDRQRAHPNAGSVHVCTSLMAARALAYPSCWEHGAAPCCADVLMRCRRFKPRATLPLPKQRLVGTCCIR